MSMPLPVHSASLARPVRLALLATAALAGCATDNAPPPTGALYEVAGTVLLKDGSPLAGGDVYLVPLETGHEARGTIGPDGTFALTTYGKPGAAEGTYRVRIEPTGEAMKPPARKGGALRPPFDRKYLDEATTDLEVAIRPEPNDLPLRLK